MAKTHHPVTLPHSPTAILPDGRELSEGDEFTIHGGGRFRFKYLYQPDGSVCAWGPTGSQYAQTRSFQPSRIKTIHRQKPAQAGVKEHPK